VKRDPIVIIVVAMVISLMLVLGYNVARKAKQDKLASAITKNGVAPDFSLQALDGKTTKLSDFRGKAVLLNFWATWCAPCKIEMPWFVELQRQYGPEGLQIIGVAMDDASTKDIADFAKEMGVNYPVLLGKEAVGDEYGGVQFLPENFYIDRNGKVVDRAFGLKGRGEIEDEIKKIIASTAVAQK
jgi:thiol-disulfide isomerase/thioredoxin